MNALLSSGISEFLAAESAELKQSLARIESVVVSIASSIPALHPAAASVPHDRILSDQSISLLQAMEATGSSVIMECPFIGGKHWRLDKGGCFHPTEPRFIEDDVAILVELGLLRLDYVGEHNTNFRITRAGSSVVSANATQ